MIELIRNWLKKRKPAKQALIPKGGFNELMCYFGLHNLKFSSKYLPNISAEIVTDCITHIECKHCGKVTLHEHLVWNGVDMVDKEVSDD